MAGDAIYSEEFITLDDQTDEEEAETKVVVKRYTSGLDDDDDDDDDEIERRRHKEVNPMRPVGAEVFEPSGGSFVKIAEKKPQKPISLKVDKEEEEEEVVTKKTGRKSKKAVEQPVVREESRKPAAKVTFAGSFGKINMVYLDVYLNEIYIILVEDIKSEFSYSPPESDEPFDLKIEDKVYRVISPGITFNMKSQKVKTTVLLLIGE